MRMKTMTRSALYLQTLQCIITVTQITQFTSVNAMAYIFCENNGWDSNVTFWLSKMSLSSLNHYNLRFVVFDDLQHVVCVSPWIRTIVVRQKTCVENPLETSLSLIRGYVLSCDIIRPIRRLSSCQKTMSISDHVALNYVIACAA